MRDDAFDALDDGAPGFTVDSVTDDAGVRVVRGTFEVPSYLAGDGAPGSTLNNGDGDDDPLPRRNGTITADFVCTVPTAATGGTRRAGPCSGTGSWAAPRRSSRSAGSAARERGLLRGRLDRDEPGGPAVPRRRDP